MAGGLPEHSEGEKNLGKFREVAEEGGSGPDSLSKVLTIGGPGGAPLWGGNLGLVGNNAAKTLGGTRGFLAAGDRDDRLKAGGQYLEKGGGGEGATGDRYKASSGIHQ